MPNDSKKPSGAEEYISAEIELSDPLDPEQEKALRDSLEKLDPLTFASLDIGEKKISTSYDPTRIAREDLLKIITQFGINLAKVETEGSPLL
jgi:hypothetical protein